MNIDFAPSPLSSDDALSANGFYFELKPLLCQTNNVFEAAANGQVDVIQSYLSTTKNKADILDQNGDSALHHAARMNRVQVIEFMLTAGAFVDMFSKEGFTPLHVAARSNSLDALDVLLKKGANPNIASKYSGCSTLHLAAQFGHKQIIHRLMNEKGLDLGATNQQGMTALHVAINRGYEEICKELVDNGASFTMTTAKGHTSLHLAAASGNTDIVSLVVQSALTKYILSYPGNAMRSTKDVPELLQFINQKDAVQNSALHIAVQTGTSSMCQVLLQHGANINIKNQCLHTPLYVATIRKNKEIMELLIKRGGQTNIKDCKQKTPLHSAASFGNPECVELLLGNCAVVDAKEVNGMTPFLCAVVAGQTYCAELLLESGADIAARDKFQRSCIHLAVENEKDSVLKMLLDRSGSGLANVPDLHERTALHYAASSSNIRLLQILLEKKANCMLRDGSGKTPLRIAAENGQARQVEALAKASLASVCQKDRDDRTAMHFAALNGNGKISSILFQMGAAVDSPDLYGWTPLLFAAKNGSTGLIRILLELNANIDHEDQTGNTALLIASARGHVQAVQFLLDKQASLKPDANGLNCLDVAIENHQAEIVMAILKNSRWKEALSAKSPDGENRMGKLIQRFPDAAKSVMDRCIQRSLAERSITDDFRLLDPGPDDQSGPCNEPFFGLMEMVKGKQKDLLVHDLCRKLLRSKWRTYGWFVYCTNLGLFGFFLLLMTYFMITERKQIKLEKVSANNDVDDIFEGKNAVNKLIPILILVFASFHLIKELYQLITQRMGYFKQLTNLIEWILYLSTIIFMLPYVFPNLASLRGDPNLTWQIGIFAVCIGYFDLILFMQTLDYVGIYVTMFFQVASTVLKASSLFALFGLAFTVIFYILFKEQEAFDSFEMGLMKVIVMTIGELDYTTMMVDSLNATNENTNAPLLPYPQSSNLFLFIFIFAMPIILTNLLVGLAVGDIESVQKSAFLRNKGKVINFVVGIERNFPKWITRRFYRPEIVVTGRKVARKITSQKFTFEDKDLTFDDHISEHEEEQKLVMLAKELAKAKQRQTSIIETMKEQMNLLQAVAARVGVETRHNDTNILQDVRL